MEHAVGRRVWGAVPGVVAVLVLGVGGCADADAPPAPGGGTTATSAGESTGTSEPRSGAVLVEVAVSGGFAGVDNRLVVREDGSWTLRSRDKEPRTGRMDADGLAELRAALEDPAYARVPERPSGRPVADGFQYTVTYHDRTVVAGEGERPTALQRVFDALPEGGPPTAP
ncbi:hypothetical protein HHL19_07450 [Streptomyces sp. R302]|uniref:hypothetical protein n=1 Tax=unclassified Streptomyces TaxID=2593676 RepID=UPI00145D8791|nr:MULTISPECIES: hypothetical protein [unclassified Streptomyces]NML54329.1 hypothetical protein [Streptomyces sp. R301]NML78503.1 hypothetical protein [Streptomyces sp. R302]